MKIYEKIAAWLVAVTIPAELVAASAIDGVDALWAWGILIAAGVLQLTAMALVMAVARGTDNPSTAVRRSPSLCTREARAVEDARPYGHGLRTYEEVRK